MTLNIVKLLNVLMMEMKEYIKKTVLEIAFVWKGGGSRDYSLVPSPIRGATVCWSFTIVAEVNTRTAELPSFLTLLGARHPSYSVR
ncbi:hypothetical protein OUZ56_007672 [Daphnia magna]|uniref:Uncharacterized protein n=1 Tax=Daphnia magna TaxID=35525 RepID=A0ABR0AAU8_9CRUS|nr:hypothetical protein OUZ56_007672 [Daphnia magna]